MKSSIVSLCDALKQIFNQLKPQSQALSCLILTGRSNQGKSTLLRQGNFDQYPIDAEGAHIYFNQQGIIIELGETWLNQSGYKLEHTLKQLNRVHRLLKITGIILCVDINELLVAKHNELKDLLKANAKLLERIGLSLNYLVDVTIIITKMDLLAGFCDFFQSEHPSDLAKPLGFSIYDASQPNKIPDIFKTKFERLVEQLGQQVTDKIHPIRSNVKRTLIREFPLQIASLRNLLLPLISSISARLFRLQSLYFTSGEQGGIILDRLNRKIQHEFALVIQDQFQQSTNYRPYFVEGALSAFQTETQTNVIRVNPKQQRLTISLAAVTAVALIGITYHYFSSIHVLNRVQHELQIAKKLNDSNQAGEALYYLAQAGVKLDSLSKGSQDLPMIQTLRSHLKLNTHDQLIRNFIPNMLADIEQALREPGQSHIERYQALRIYLMLADRQHFQADAILRWFTQRWQTNPKEVNKKLSLLKQTLQDNKHQIRINQQTVTDARNYLNALPASYLYYSLAKLQFDTSIHSLEFQGFQLSNSYIPVYMTQEGFQKVIASLTTIAQRLTSENWILERQDTGNLVELLQKTYCEDYVNWWKHFLQNTQPLHAQNYAQVNQLTQTLLKSESISKILQWIQTHTHPRTGPNAALFNLHIASKFSDLNLLSQSNLQHLSGALQELAQFSKTLSLVSDQGKTAYSLTKARFQGDKLANPISDLYSQAQQYPEPLAKWTEQIADDMWFNLIGDSRLYLNHQWQELVYQDYNHHIAHHFPLDNNQQVPDLPLPDFNRFFSPHGKLAQFTADYIKPFLDTTQSQWQRKEMNHAVVPIPDETIHELMRANVITHMFFPQQQERGAIEFSLQKINLDPMIAQFQLNIGTTELVDNQNSDSYTAFHWPQSGGAQLHLRSIEGRQFELSESGPWAIFKLLQKVNVMVDEQDSSNLQILFEINGNAGRYLLKAQNQVNPFIPGILSGFNLQEKIA